MSLIDQLLEKNLIPDFLIRIGIRSRIRQRLNEENHGSLEKNHQHEMNLIKSFKQSPIAVETKAANIQHYEVPTEFYKLCLGKHLKYSCAYWNDQTRSLDEAEALMLALSCKRAQIENGNNILELGCGWGSLSLWMAEHYPNSHITAVSNSKTQKDYIDAEADRRGLKNLKVITADMNHFSSQDLFDRIISIEMFEHMRNHEKLMEKIASWLKSEGTLFIHIFTHRLHTYLFEDRTDNDWMARHFFTGGMMPSHQLLHHYQKHLFLEEEWLLSGSHYNKTAEAWLQKMDLNSEKINLLFQKTYGSDVKKWKSHWRIFFMACAELWGFRGGEEWSVSHYLFRKR
ncbi:MAG: class I SAM-dependent methyltransferase [Deltaproteobacteria bacterium]|nr:class I SAM-dependent methyltransferase [Deltaproteobacteria bacterium]